MKILLSKLLIVLLISFGLPTMIGDVLGAVRAILMTIAINSLVLEYIDFEVDLRRRRREIP